MQPEVEELTKIVIIEINVEIKVNILVIISNTSFLLLYSYTMLPFEFMNYDLTVIRGRAAYIIQK